MSMELYVLSDEELPSLAAWQQAIKASGFEVKLSTERSLAELRGALPVLLDDRHTAFECDHWDAAELIAEWSEVDLGRSWRRALAMRWGGDLYAAASAYFVAAAYATATGGVILDCEEGKIISPQRAAEIARELQQSQPLIDEAVRRVSEQFQKKA
jgi:hypothetical protein